MFGILGDMVMTFGKLWRFTSVVISDNYQARSVPFLKVVCPPSPNPKSEFIESQSQSENDLFFSHRVRWIKIVIFQ